LQAGAERLAKEITEELLLDCQQRHVGEVEELERLEQTAQALLVARVARDLRLTLLDQR
jgi:hypothetical protein